MWCAAAAAQVDINPRQLLIDQMEFHAALRTRFGFRGPLHLIDELFASLDTDR
jgi:hypothetical protein